MRDHGWLSVNKVAAAKAGSKQPRRGKGRRVPKSTFVEQRSVALGDGTTATIDLFARDGAIGITTLTDNGEQRFDELRRVRTQRHEDKSGKYRWYNQYRLPDRLGGGTITVRLHGNKDDEKRRFNRTENIRPIPAID